MESDPFNSTADHLANMMNTDTSHIWRHEELGDILKHQLAAPVRIDLSNVHSQLRAKLANLSDAQGLTLKSFSDLFFHPHPPVELLKMTKTFAKSSANHPDSPLPPEIATTLYFASITAALVRCGERITELNDQDIKHGLDWLTHQQWVEQPLKQLLEDGIKLLSESEGPS